MIQMTRKEYDTFSRIIEDVNNEVDKNLETRGRTAFVWNKLEENDRMNIFAVGLMVAAIIKGDVFISDEEFRIKG